ncbi:hypothetical protein BMT54_11535 [Pasteurellaceae bacterium 15-036681]|nr:hypothetical protein BMT54_11535 [Pasteurellaceae bacterium 15-036681]
MSRFGNQRKQNSLAKLSTSIIETSGIEAKCKFNFAYFDAKDPSKDFVELGFDNLCDFINKLKEFTKEPLEYWIRRWEKHNSPLEIYGSFPPKNKTIFEFPKHVPADVKWGRFRLNSEVRLIGFIIPEELHNCSPEPHNGFLFDKNTFYVVFLDLHHQFWISEKKNT